MTKSSANKYHFIITGAGCAGLSLLVHLISSGKFATKKILLIDRSPKNANDRTWCFWETTPELFESIVYRRWDTAWYHSNGFSRLLELSPYQYKMIRGIDFYDHCLDLIRQQNDVEILYAPVESINHDETSVQAGGNTYYAEYIFNSILFEKPLLSKNEFYLQQHFKGWMIETTEAVFNPAQATLMDFRVAQQHGTTFVYVLPVSSRQAMIEYTLFTRDLLRPQQYDEGLTQYIDQFIPCKYTVTEEEAGIIPMTNHVFSRGKGNVINIGSAGGQTKPSSGYTFYFIQQHSKAITDALLRNGKPFVNATHAKKFRYYDSVLLNVLATEKLPGKSVFDALFKNNRPVDVLQFLNNESALATDIKIIGSLPTSPFLRAGLQQMLR